MPIKESAQAPDFSLPDENDVIQKLSNYHGKFVVLYFYPKDDTPGCTVEACNFRDDYDGYLKANVTILGVSPDDTKSHTKFISKYTLPFPLLADKDHKVCDLYGTWGPKVFMGRKFDGVLRTTFLIGRDGKIIKVFENVKPSEHSQDVLAMIHSLEK